MELFEAMSKRCSVRKYLAKPVEDRKLEKILEAINEAPSAGNLQAYKVYLIRKALTKKRLSDAAFGQSFIEEAPVVLVFCAAPKESARRYGERGANLYSVQDATIAASYAQLAATALGLASCWVGAFDEEKVKEILKIEKELPVAIIPIGYAAEKSKKPKRKKLEEIICFGEY